MSGPASGGPRKPGQATLLPLPKRFYKDVSVEPIVPSPVVPEARTKLAGEGQGGGRPRRFWNAPTPNPSPQGGGEQLAFRLLLDGKPVRTPARNALILPTRALAEAIAPEWAAQDPRIDPATMPLTRLANSALDGVAGREAAVRADIVKYAGSDLLCYRAESPPGLVRIQTETWDPVLAWASKTFGAPFRVATGVMPTRQSARVTDGIARAFDARGAFELACLHVMTTLMGSAVLALAHAHGHLSAEAAWSAAHVDEDWQISQWGEDSEAQARRERRGAEMQAASRMLALLR